VAGNAAALDPPDATRPAPAIATSAWSSRRDIPSSPYAPTHRVDHRRIADCWQSTQPDRL